MRVPLPPLPPVSAWGDEPTGRSMLDILTDEHRQALALCARLDAAAAGPGRARVADVLTAVISRHLSAERQYLYPTVRAVLPDGERIAAAETAAGRRLLCTLRRLAAARGAGGQAYRRLVVALRAELQRHADEAEQRVLPRLREVCRDADLVRLGNRILVAEEAAPTRPHPRAPDRPPWNKLVDPVLGVADKLRDVLTRRVTYPADL